MLITEHIDALDQEGARLAEAAASAPWDSPVPTCPDWRMRDLVLHTGQAHRWAATYLTGRHERPLSEAEEQAVWGAPPGDGELLDWFREGHRRLVTALEKAPADLTCWTFLPAPSPPAFWARRQAHETTVHRFDAEAAAGITPQPVSAPLALDGLDELLSCFMVRPTARVRSDRPRTLLVQAPDGDGDGNWLLTVSAEPLVVSREPGPADCTVRGRAADLYLMLWNRLPQTAVEASGDLSLLRLWQETAQIRWSRAKSRR